MTLPLWIIGVVIGIGCLGIVLMVCATAVERRIYRHEDPPAVPLSPRLLQTYRDELVWNAMRKPKQKLRAGQSRRPL